MALLACSPLGSSAMLKISAAAFFYSLLPFHASYSFCFKRCWALCQITVLTLVHSQILIELDFRTFNFFQAMRCEIRKKRAIGMLFEMCTALDGSVARYYRLTPTMVGFIVNPDQWCRHDRGQAWPGSSTPYWDLPHHLPRGGARSESINGLSRSISGASPFPSAPRTLRFTRPGGGRPRKPLGPNGGWVSHWGKIPAWFRCLLLFCAA